MTPPNNWPHSLTAESWTVTPVGTSSNLVGVANCMKVSKRNEVVLQNGYNKIKRTKYGYMMYNAHDVYVGGSFNAYGEFSDEEVQFVCSHLNKDSIAFDIGANYGALTIPMALKSKLVYAFEPQRQAFYAACANLALNCLDNVVMENAGLSDVSGFVDVPMLDFNSENNIGGLGMKQVLPEQFKDVPSYKSIAYTLDEYVYKHKIEKVDFIKMDVEGMEELVLMGGKTTIEKFKPLLYVEADREEKVESLAKYIDYLGYNMQWHKPPLYSPNNYFKNQVIIWGRQIISINLFCTPK